MDFKRFYAFAAAGACALAISCTSAPRNETPAAQTAPPHPSASAEAAAVKAPAEADTAPAVKTDTDTPKVIISEDTAKKEEIKNDASSQAAPVGKAPGKAAPASEKDAILKSYLAFMMESKEGNPHYITYMASPSKDKLAAIRADLEISKGNKTSKKALTADFRSQLDNSDSALVKELAASNKENAKNMGIMDEKMLAAIFEHLQLKIDDNKAALSGEGITLRFLKENGQWKLDGKD